MPNERAVKTLIGLVQPQWQERGIQIRQLNFGVFAEAVSLYPNGKWQKLAGGVLSLSEDRERVLRERKKRFIGDGLPRVTGGATLFPRSTRGYYRAVPLGLQFRGRAQWAIAAFDGENEMDSVSMGIRGLRRS